MVERNFFNSLDHSACSISALASNDRDGLGLLHVDDIILVGGLPVVFSSLISLGHGLLDGHLVWDILLNLDFARYLHTLVDHGRDGHLLGDRAHSVFGGSSAGARGLGHRHVAATAVDLGFWGSDDSDLSLHSFVLHLLHLLHLPLHLIFFNHLNSIPDGLLVNVGSLGPRNRSLLLDLFLPHFPLWHIDFLSLP